ncbi:uncharacterized protein [Typha latifolia]|uniref:uncharacterized protein n=1 Tax=Typha latifolia TaxID=4733 RepID=UPI003C3079CE
MEKKTSRFWDRPWRWAKTLFFLLSMLASLLFICAPPLLIVVLDLLLPPSLLSTSLHHDSLSSRLKNFTFRSSLIDVPIISIARSLIILCAYVVCDGKGAYLGITTACSLSSMGYVVLKAISIDVFVGKEVKIVAVEALFLASLALALAHIGMAYRTSCKERRKLLVYRIDIEAVKLKAGQPKYEERERSPVFW